MPLPTADSILTSDRRRDVTRALPVLFAWTLRTGGVNPPTQHMRFPGTITIPDQAFQQLLEYAARSFKLAGFQDIVFIGDHGGYQAQLRTVADRLNREWSAAGSVRAHAVLEYYRA